MRRMRLVMERCENVSTFVSRHVQRKMSIFAVFAIAAAAMGQVASRPATTPAAGGRDVVTAARAGLEALWDQRVEMHHEGATRVAYAAGREVDGQLPALYADESGAWADGTPIWDFQGRDGTAAAILTFLRAYEVLGDAVYLDRARQLVETADAVAAQLGGWPQDAAVHPDGTIQPVMVWGAPGNRRHFPDSLRGCWTMDDATTQSMCVALIEYARVTRNAMWLGPVRQISASLRETRLIGVPQWMPLERAPGITANQNNDARSPQGPYMASATLNDGATPAWGRTLIALASVADQLGMKAVAAAAMEDAERIAKWLIELPGPGWGQQYDEAGRMRWGRHMEPPLFITGETGVVPFLAHARAQFLELRPAIDKRLDAYFRWLWDLPRPEGYPTRVWRHYIEWDASWLPAFARDFQVFVGSQNAAQAAGGQPWHGDFDLHYARWCGTPAAGFDLARLGVYAGSAISDVVRLNASNVVAAPGLAERQVRGTWPIDVRMSTGQIRKACTTAAQCLNTLCLIEAAAKGGKIEPPQPPKPTTQPTVPPATQPLAEEDPTTDDRWLAGKLGEILGSGRRGGRIELEAKTYRFARPWNLRGFEGVQIVGQGPATRVEFALTGASAWCAIDLTASRRCRLADFDIHTAAGKPVETLILLGREKQAGGSHGEHVFERIQTEVHASLALIVNHGSEECWSTRCEWSNFAAGGWVFLTAHDPIYGARTRFGTFGGGSNTQPMRFSQCHLGVYGDRGDEGLIRIGPMTSWLIVDGGGASVQTQTPADPRTGGRCAILIEPEVNRPVQIVSIRDWQSETFGARNWLRVEPRVVNGVRAGVVAGLAVDGCQMVAREEVISIGAGAVLADSRVTRPYLIGGLAQYDWATPGDRPLMRVEAGASTPGSTFELEPVHLRHGAGPHPQYRWADTIERRASN